MTHVVRTNMSETTAISRRALLSQCSYGVGALGLAAALSDELLAAGPATTNTLAPRPGHFPARAKHIIHLWMNGGPSQVDTFDPKPALKKYAGQRPASTAHLST